jgi:hypothetical protein
MNSWGFLWVGLVVLVAGIGALTVGAVRRRQALVLVGTVATALGAVAAISGWLLVADHATLGDALKTGGPAGASVVALYGLWLNDRRRRVEEERHRVESGRVDHERFARAVELLGNDADQVRVGALHALAGLARGNQVLRHRRRHRDHPQPAAGLGRRREPPPLRPRHQAPRLQGTSLPVHPQLRRERLDIRSDLDTARKHGKNAIDVLYDLMLSTPWQPPAPASSP